MRSLLSLTLLFTPLAAMAQSAQSPDAQITRDQFVQRAATAAGRRFDAVDTNHTGLITRAQLRAWRAAHQGQTGPSGSASQ